MLSINATTDTQLRLLEGREAPLLFALTEQNRSYLRNWLPWLETHTQLEDTLRFIEGARERYANRESAELGIIHRDHLIGMIGFNLIDWESHRGEMGYWLDESHQGQGIVHSACIGLINFAFFQLGLNRLEIRCATLNARSRRVPERLGFICEGTMRQAEWLYDHYVDHALYALLKEDWNDEDDI